MTELHPGAHVARRADAPAVIMANSGTTVTYRQLDERSNRVAQLLRSAGLQPGDHIGIMMENHPRYFEIFWGAQRAGLYTTPINWHLKAEEAGYIIDDCGATAVFVSAALSDVAAELSDFLGNVRLRLMVDGVADGYEGYEDAISKHPAEPLHDEVEGQWMFYSSGTTGRPKGIMPAIQPGPFGSGAGALVGLLQGMYGFSPDRFEYHNDPAKTASAYNDRGWSSLGDIGYVDDDGFVYLTDRASHMIIPGGVNIYPQEVENELTLHPKVADVAVIGVPNPDLGEEVKAVVIAANPSEAGDALGQELIGFCRSRLAHYKCPVSVDFVDDLPRLPTGKLLKRQLQDQYAAR